MPSSTALQLLRSLTSTRRCWGLLRNFTTYHFPSSASNRWAWAPPRIFRTCRTAVRGIGKKMQYPRVLTHGGRNTDGRTRTPHKQCSRRGGSERRRSEEHTSELQSLRHLVCRL